MAVFGLQQVVISTESKGSVLMKNETTDDGGSGFFVDNPPRLFPTVCHIMLFSGTTNNGAVIAVFLPSTVSFVVIIMTSRNPY